MKPTSTQRGVPGNRLDLSPTVMTIGLVTPLSRPAPIPASEPAGGTPQIDVDPLDRDKPTVIALREIEAGKVGLEMLNRGQA